MSSGEEVHLSFVLSEFKFIVTISFRNLVPKVNFIDYEYGDYNYREYDIANHFNEFVGMGDENGDLDYQKYYPSKSFQIKWIEAYLTQTYAINGINEVPPKHEVTKFWR